MSRLLARWVAHHGHALLSTAGHLSRHRMATLLTVLALSLALALPLALQVLLRNLRNASGPLTEAVGLTVYLKRDTDAAHAQALAKSIQARDDVASVRLISAAQGLALLRTNSGLAQALDALGDNPLPAVLEVHASGAGAARLSQLRSALAALPEVDNVQLDRDWAVRFDALLALARRAVLTCAALLGLGVIAIIGNTIRLEIQARAPEIEVTRLVGGSNAFVRRPFLYAGVFYGVSAAVIACVLVDAARLALAGAATQLAAAYGSHYVLLGPGLRDVGAALAAGALLGWLGAALAAARQLARIAPRG